MNFCHKNKEEAAKTFFSALAASFSFKDLVSLNLRSVRIKLFLVTSSPPNRGKLLQPIFYFLRQKSEHYLFEQDLAWQYPQFYQLVVYFPRSVCKLS